MTGVAPPPTHLAAVQQNARALRQRGDLTGARAMLEHALDVAGTAYGAAHPDVIETARLLAALHREGGDLSAARRRLEETIAAAALRRPESDPLMLLLAYDLGEVADEFGNRHEARRNMSTVARLGPAALGPDHPAVRGAERYLATPTGPAQAGPAQASQAQASPAQPGPAQPGPAQTGPAQTDHISAGHAPVGPAQPDHAPPAHALFDHAPPGHAPTGPAPLSPASLGHAPTGPAPPGHASTGPAPLGQTPAGTPTRKPVPLGPRPTHARPGAHGRASRADIRTVWIVVLVLILVAGAASAVVFGPWRDRPAVQPTVAPTTAPKPTASPAPTGVRLRDDGSSITLTWREPTSAAVPIIVAGGRAGEQSRPFAQLPAGRTAYTVNGLNARLEYCFAIVAVYSAEHLVPSELVCTRRIGSPQPTSS